MKLKFLLFTLAAVVCLWLGVEGARSIFLGDKLHWSLVHEFSNIFRPKAAPLLKPIEAQPVPTKAETSSNADLPFLAREEELKNLIPDMQYAKVMLGNSPFRDELGAEEARITVSDPKKNILRLKPDLNYRFIYLKTNLYNPLDPLAFSVAKEQPLTPALEAFIKRYGFVEADFSTNAFGERTTLPRVEAEEIILVAGDSVAFGAAVNDEEHLASQLQRLISDKKFISVAVPGAGIDDALVLMDEALTRYSHRVSGVVYVLCENDYQGENTPSRILNKLSQWLQDRKIATAVIVYQQYLQRTMPEIFRREVEEYKTYEGYKKDFLALASEKNIPVVDFSELVERYRNGKRSILAGAALYADHCHFSPEGHAKVAQEILQKTHDFKTAKS